MKRELNFTGSPIALVYWLNGLTGNINKADITWARTDTAGKVLELEMVVETEIEV